MREKVCAKHVGVERFAINITKWAWKLQYNKVLLFKINKEKTDTIEKQTRLVEQAFYRKENIHGQ